MPHILVIGGGALGLLSARELALAGARVTLLERGNIGRESSWAGGGILSPLYPWRYPDSITRLASWSQAHYAELSASLLENTGIDPEHLNSGLLIHAPGEQETAMQWAEQHGHRLQRADQDTVTRLEPARRSPPGEMLWMPDIRQIRNPRLTRALHADILRLGVRVHSHTRVRKLLCDGTRVTGVRCEDDLYQADQVLLCAGAWSNALLANCPPKPDIRPVRGQMILFRSRPGTIRHILLEENRYVIPRKDGRILFGSTLEETGFDKSTTTTARAELHRLICQRFPQLQSLPIEKHWAGLRPGSPAGIPYIGRHPQYANLFLNTGHYRNGLVLGPASARLAADLMLERPPCVDPQPYQLGASRG